MNFFFITIALSFICAVLATTAATTTSAERLIQVHCNPDPATGGGGELVKARDTIRAMPRPLNESVRVLISGSCVPPAGVFSTKSALLDLDDPSKDSGESSQVKITWDGSGAGDAKTVSASSSSSSSSKKAKLLGGIKLPFAHFKRWSKNDKILTFNLSLVGFDAPRDLGSFASGGGGLGECNTDRAELFVDAQPQIVGREPNANFSATKGGGGPWMDWFHIKSVPSALSSFTAASPRKHPRQAAALRKAAAESGKRPAGDALNPLYALGGWSWDWAQSTIAIANLTYDASADAFEFTADPKTPPVYGFKPTARFFVQNSLYFVDSENEYFIDARENVLYFFPPASFSAASDVYLSVASKPLLAASSPPPRSQAPLRHVHFENMQLSYGRVSGVAFTSPVANVALRNVDVSGFGQTCVGVGNALNATLDSLAVRYCGCSGIAIGGGDVETLAPSSNSLVVNSDISFAARLVRVYNPGIHYSGVGLIFRANLIHSLPHSAILGAGNDILVESNTVRDVLFGCRDCGAFYSGRSWVRRHQRVVSNTFTNVFTAEPTVLGSPLVVAVYLDDELSGETVENNTFTNCDGGLLLGGGRDNIIRANVCNGIFQHCIHFDNRGMNWQNNFCNPKYENSTAVLVQGLFAVHYQQPPYSVRYPNLPTTLSDRPCVPVGNVIEGNKCSGAVAGFIDQSKATIESWGSTIRENSGCGA